LTQNGYQTIYAGASLSKELESMSDNEKAESTEESEDSPGFALLVALALLLIVGTVITSLIGLLRGGTRVELASSALPAIALVLLLIQLLIGFPLERAIAESRAENAAQSQSESGPGQAFNDSMTAMLMSSIQVKTTTVFLFVLLVLAVPTLIFANSLINRYRKDVPGPTARE